MNSPAFEPVSLGPLTLRNAIIKAATFEGATPKGLVTNDLIDFHRRVARGGVAMSTVAYLAVSPEGRTDRHCILLGQEAIPGLGDLTKAIHDEGALAAAQLGHAGPVANGRSNGLPALGPSRRLTPLGGVIHEISEADIERVTTDYATGAALAVAAGFDCLEIHLGHNYLLSAFLSPKLNRRKDGFGGPLADRARFARQVVAAVRGAVGPGIALTAKLNMTDGVRRGFAVDESLLFARLLEDDGHLDALELTSGSSLANPMYLFHGDVPRAEFAATLPPWARLGFALFGRRFLRSYPFSEAYFLPLARRFRSALDMPLILLGGITQLATVENALAEGFSFVAVARALLREPDLVNIWARQPEHGSLCTHCNKCMPTIYRGTRCVLVEAGETRTSA